MRCPHCTHPNPDEAKFCNECGSRLGGQGAGRRDPVDYTPGHLAATVLRDRSALEGERKQVTVLFADLQGSLELARHFDPERWHRILDQFFEILTDGVHRFEGTVNQYTGDGIMALFGAPLAHEDHAQRACHAALRIAARLRVFEAEFERQHARGFPVRMGLNSGEVVVGKIGDDLRMDYTAQGHVVGVAARLEEAAPAGTIYVSQSVEERVRGFFRTRELGPLELSGVGAPVRVHVLEGVAHARTRLEVAGARGFSPFVGRVQPMVTLEKALEHVRGGKGVAVGVEGEAGVGKSRLCLEFAQHCLQRRVPLWEVHCPSHGGGIAHLAVRSLLRSLLGVRAGTPATETVQRVASQLEPLTDPRSLALVLDLLGAEDAKRAAAAIDEGERSQRLAQVVVDLIRLQTAEEAGVLLVDDLHWVDPESEAVLFALAERVPELPLLLLVNFRPERPAPWSGLPHNHELGLRPLSDESSCELLSELLGAHPSTAELSRRIQQAASGNPFFIEELIRSLAESGSLEGEPGAYLVAVEAELEIPETVRQVVAARIDRLGQVDKALLQVASVIGRSFSLGLLGRVAPLPDDELAASLSRLEAAQFIWREMQVRRENFSFTHPLTREVANGSLLGERRESFHKLVASALEESPAGLGERAGVIAHHWEAAGNPREAARWRLRAGFRVSNLVPRRRWGRPGSGGSPA